MRPLLMVVCVAPSAAMALLTMPALVSHILHPATRTGTMVYAVFAIVVTVLAAVALAELATRGIQHRHSQALAASAAKSSKLQEQLDEMLADRSRRSEALISLIAKSRVSLNNVQERLVRGERLAQDIGLLLPGNGEEREPVVVGIRELHRAAIHALIIIANMNQPTGLFVKIARRNQVLIQRVTEALDGLENKYEDPEILDGLFAIDHLVTLSRRLSDDLAVLGGEPPRRRWAEPISVPEILRGALQEVEDYRRVKILASSETSDDTIAPDTAPGLMHLLAALIENGTQFSEPDNLVLLRTTRVRAGLLIEVEDRGLGMTPQAFAQSNAALADPSRVNVVQLLRDGDGRIGLYVVSALAYRYRVTVELQTNVFGGVTAVVIIPHELVNHPDPTSPPAQHTATRPPGRHALKHGDPPHPDPAPPVRHPQQPMPSTPSLPPADAASPISGPASGGRPPLPQRVPGAGLAPQLQEEAKAPSAGPPPDPRPAVLGGFRRTDPVAERPGPPGNAADPSGIDSH